VSALPAEPCDDQLDPQRILTGLPEDERELFLSEYRTAVDAARDPAGWATLVRLLRMWGHHAGAARQPGYPEALEGALGSSGGGMFLEDAIRLRRPGA
jgi:hypothetical protein